MPNLRRNMRLATAISAAICTIVAAVVGWEAAPIIGFIIEEVF